MVDGNSRKRVELMKVLAIACWLSCGLVARGAAPVGDVHVASEQGFQIEIPDDWTSVSQETDEGFTLTVYRQDSGGTLAVAVTRLTLEDDATTATLAEKARAAVEADSETYTDYREFSTQLAGEDAAGVRVVYHSGSDEYQLLVRYLVVNGLGFKVQCHGPLAIFADHEEDLDEIVDGFQLLELSDDLREAMRLEALASACGTEVRWAKGWEDAARRAHAEDQLILVVAFLLGGFEMPDTPLTTLFMEQHVINLVEERFVPLLYPGTDLGPLKEKYGMGPSSFGQALIVCRPNGDIVLETPHTMDSDVAFPFLLEALQREPSARGRALPDDLQGLDRVERLLERGDLREARELLEGESDARAYALRARIFQRLRAGPEALAAVRIAREKGDDSAQLDLLEARLLARAGNDERAVELLEGVRGGAEDTEFARRATFELGIHELARGNPDRTRELWRELTRGDEASRWSWRAAAALRSSALEFGVLTDLDWPDADILAEQLVFHDPATEEVPAIGEVQQRAVQWLLEHQRENGSWVSPDGDSAKSGLGADPFIDSYTALAGRALLRDTESEATRDAVLLALEYIERSLASRKKTPPRVFYMDFMTWSDSMMLDLFVDAVERKLVKRGDVSQSVRTLVEDLSARQQRNGGWSYYKKNDLSAADVPAQSISFTTAAAVQALARADQAGFSVPDDLLERGVDALTRMRNENGVFSYFLYEHEERGKVGANDRGDVGRGPVCESALFLAGASDSERVAGTIGRFLEVATFYTAEQGKALMHAGPEAQGCHYLLFDLMHAAQSWRAADGDPRTAALLRECVLECRQADGSFLDTPILGRSFGTAMALLALDALRLDE